MDTEYLKNKVAEFCRIPVETLSHEVSIEGLVADSFMMVEMMLMLQEESGKALTHEDLDGVRTLGDLFSTLERKS